MENKYSISKDENGKIIWVSIENENGEKITKKIKNTTNDSKYMEELRSINSEYNDFFTNFFTGNYESKNAAYFEKAKEKENRQNYKEYKKQIKSKHQSQNSLRRKIASLSIAAIVAVTAVAGYGTIKTYIKNESVTAKNKNKNTQINEQNPELARIYAELLKTKNGEKIVKQLQETDQWQDSYNTRIAKYPDADGNVLFLKAREVSAVQDISNAENTAFTSLDYDDTRFCDYLSAGAVTHKGLYVSEESTEEYTLIHDEDTRNEMRNEEEFALSAMKGNKTTKEIDKHFDELMKTGLTYTASGVNVAYLGEGSNIVVSDEGRSSKKLTAFIEKVKTNNEGANKLDTYAKSKDVTKKQRELIDQAWIEMDKENIKVDLKSRDKFEMSTTKKGLKKMAALVPGGYLSLSGSTYTYTTKDGKTIKISKKEALEKFGEDKVKEAEKNAEDKIKVDTNGDGEKDKTITEANKDEEEKKNKLEEEARSYEQDYAQGRSDGYAGRAKAKNTAGYNAGYANGKKQRAAENEPDEIIEKKEEYPNAPTEKQSLTTQTIQNTQETKKIQTIEREGVTYESEPVTTSKVRSYKALV